MIRLVGLFTALAVVLLIVGCPLSRRGRGRHVSRPLGRLAGLNTATLLLLQALWLILASGWALFVGTGIVPLLMQSILTSWLLDDLLTGGRDDDHDRKRGWAKAKLRMPKPVKLRPAERWAPSPTLA